MALAWPGGPPLARALAAEGATVVVVGGGEEAGRLAAEIEQAGSGRVAVFAGDGSEAGARALADFVAELFRAPAGPDEVEPAEGPPGEGDQPDG